jgi:hypothetical protein
VDESFPFLKLSWFVEFLSIFSFTNEFLEFVVVLESPVFIECA